MLEYSPRPEWSFHDAIAWAFRRYRGGGMEAKGSRNNLLLSWAELVGSARALAEFDDFIAEQGGFAAGAKYLHIAENTLKALRKRFLTFGSEAIAARPDRELHAGDLIADTYRIDRRIGEGGTSRVYAVTRLQDSASLAAKVLSSHRFPATEPQRLRFAREYKIQNSFFHRGVIRVVDFVEDGDVVAIISELATAGSLYTRLKSGRIQPASAIDWMQQLASALLELHHRRIVHRDITPKNILFRDEHEVALADFGISRHVDDATVTSAVDRLGSLIYISARQRTTPHEASFEDDVYSLGQVFYYLISGVEPHGSPPPLVPAQTGQPAAVCDLVTSLRSFEPRDRPHMEAVVQSLATASGARKTKRAAQTTLF